jgi:hypothetical protein
MREAKMAVEKSEVEIVKPRNDKREYRRVLLPNSMEVCLISDPDTDKVSSLSPSRYFWFLTLIGIFFDEIELTVWFCATHLNNLIVFINVLNENYEVEDGMLDILRGFE